ncbi:hypothetical protein [Streptomyces sp. cmx-4-9]|uniref:hypothetical protein n=1 Tax=Streptomyces sp. cmx-4-9 TaxID=2790941 RepID=UPI00397F54E7
MSARRPLLTALGATTLLAALWFVPSAGAVAPGHPAGAAGASTGADATGQAPATGPGSGSGSGSRSGADPGPDAAAARTAPQAARAPLLLADTGSADTTPYLLGGTLCLGLGAGCVAFSVRRSQH